MDKRDNLLLAGAAVTLPTGASAFIGAAALDADSRWAVPLLVTGVLAVLLGMLCVLAYWRSSDTKSHNSTSSERRKAREATEKELGEPRTKSVVESKAAREARRTVEDLRQFLKVRDRGHPGPNGRTPSGLDAKDYDAESSRLGMMLSIAVKGCYDLAEMEMPGERTGLERYVATEWDLNVDEPRQAVGDLECFADRLAPPLPPNQ